MVPVSCRGDRRDIGVDGSSGVATVVSSSVSLATSIGNDTAADTVDGVVVVAVVVLSFLAVFFVRAMSSCQLRNVK